ncbi:hypothetical protein E1B28_008990 [Marasmius oreades]|uniref:Gti1/Pac2 family-domain-containing protein n=1 Tax=Marasmius oreades TaxID=181124 RepID=A0A9P7S144_9AGAR|nr:uncharacterized protein E1B28_008990 [Marasmius oreades]KAG7092653.1 hypothetical protein E1B28_008990 [Marasmius oreades]
MQEATHSRLHVRDARDAHVVFEAVRLGILLPVTRRLNEAERSICIRSGSVFVWEESDDEAGLKRWTDGRVWGQSRMREPYLFYDEKLPSDGGPGTDKRSPIIRFVDGTRSSSSALVHQNRSGGNHTGLIKQAYSVWAYPSPHSKPRKWHITAYFTYADLPFIPTIDQDPTLSRIGVPPGVYRAGKTRSETSTTPSTGSHSGGSSAALPPLHSTVGHYMGHTHTAQGSHGSRLPEDHRMIQMLNSRHI